MDAAHLSDDDLERYVTGMVHHDAEVAFIERHLYACNDCAQRMWALQDSLDATQAGLRLDDEETSGKA